MIVLEIISLFMLIISILFFGTGILVLKDDKSKIICSVMTFGYIVTMLAYMIK